MNFVDKAQVNGIKVELKYCERCGGLWLRPAEAGGVYCNSCRTSLEARPDPGAAPPRKTRRRKKMRVSATETGVGDLRGLFGIGYLQAGVGIEARL